MNIETKAAIATGFMAAGIATLIGTFIMYPVQTVSLIGLGLCVIVALVLFKLMYLEFKDYFNKKQNSKRKISIAPKGWNKE
jgi:hypothetical protein